ncbi:MAG: macro domain-containing protein [Faecousia sp.]
MPFEIVRNDIANMCVDAIVNTANPKPVIGYGVDAGIHRKAGPELLAARQRIGDIPVGGAAITPGFRLNAKYVIHTVGPVWVDGSHREEKLLRACYEKSLRLAKRQGCASVAFPLISAGNHGFPKPLALRIAMNAISEFLMGNEMRVYLVVFSRDAFRLSEKLFQGVSSFIDEHYVQEKNLQQYGLEDKCALRGVQQETVLREQMRRRAEEAASCDAAPCPPMAAAPCPSMAAPPKRARKGFSFPKPKPSLAELLAETDAGFSETLLKLIDETGKKDSEIYTKANLTRQHFSKIRNNPHYQPTKPTAIALALALELDLEQTRDLIGRAGYALTNSSKFDVIIMYFIRERNFNLFDINAALFEFDQSLLGAQ